MRENTQSLRVQLLSLEKEYRQARESVWEIQKQIAPLIESKSILLRRLREIEETMANLQQTHLELTGAYYSEMENSDNEKVDSS